MFWYESKACGVALLGGVDGRLVEILLKGNWSSDVLSGWAMGIPGVGGSIDFS